MEIVEFIIPQKNKFLFFMNKIFVQSVLFFLDIKIELQYIKQKNYVIFNL